jgi:uncharacterized membrane protein (UPF0182 family)
MIARIELNRPRFRMHVSLLIGVTLLSMAAQMWLKRYEYTIVESAQFTGAGYVESQQLFVYGMLAILTALLGVATILFQKRGRPYVVPMFGAIVLVALFGLGMIAYPFILKRAFVNSDRLNKEGPFAARAIAMTRTAYDLDRIDVRDMDVQPVPATDALASGRETLQSVRLWDPDVLRTALESLQGMRPYYRFEDVDIDRYVIDGKATPVMISARDLELGGLEPSAQNWTNLRLRFTHGYGITMSRVDRATTDGRPQFLVEGIPLQNKSPIPLSEPRIYFSDWRDSFGRPRSEYALVNTGEAELDYETATGATTHQWKGDRGIPISGFLTRLAFSVVLSDGNLLVSPNVRPGVRLLMRRSVVERAARVLPFLQFDKDPYLVILNGRLVWVLDGYTTSDMFPYSLKLEGANYIRNTVKATVDAYTGEIAAYAIEPTEPILRAWREVYPGLVRDIGEAPKGLAEHFRYPEDLLQRQASILQTYHVTDPTTFLSNSDAWNIATEIDVNRNRAAIRPYYVQMQLPGEAKTSFMQILPFTPNRKPNMSGWLAAHCDPESYGKLSMYRFVGNAPDGPELMESNFNSTPEISEINRQFINEQSTVIPGNLLVLPIGQSVMYVEPLFLQGRTSGIQAAPRLSWVVLAFNDKTVVGNTFQQALDRLTGSQTAPAGTAAPTPPKDRAGTVTAKQALELLRRAEEAQRAGDWALYGDLQRQLKRALEGLAKG